jgi:acyl-coenzyme A thioesterase PaaI-like protein
MTGLFKTKTKITWQILLFGLTQVPMIFYCRPKVVSISDRKLEIKIKLNRRTKNHLNSMYFGILSVGADVTSGFLAMKLIQASKSKINLIFKDFHADFLKRAEGDVHFICEDGIAIQNLVRKAEETGERQNLPVEIVATVPKISDEPVAKFVLTLSIKKKSK